MQLFDEVKSDSSKIRENITNIAKGDLSTVVNDGSKIGLLSAALETVSISFGMPGLGSAVGLAVGLFMGRKH